MLRHAPVPCRFPQCGGGRSGNRGRGSAPWDVAGGSDAASGQEKKEVLACHQEPLEEGSRDQRRKQLPWEQGVKREKQKRARKC